MLLNFKICNSKKADEILLAIAEKKRELDDLLYELRHCLNVEAEIKESSHGNDCSEKD